jgi:hypothetical protein
LEVGEGGRIRIGRIGRRCEMDLAEAISDGKGAIGEARLVRNSRFCDEI